MNKSKYNLVRLINMLKGFFPSIFSLLIPKKSNRFIFSSEFNSTFNQNSKYLFLSFINDKNIQDVKFVVNEPLLRGQLTELYGDYFISSSSLRSIFYILRAKTWITSSLETPVGGAFLNVGRIVIHLGHGAPLKKIGLNEKYNNWIKSIYYRVLRTNFSYFFSTSSVFDNNWAGCLSISTRKVLRAAQSRNITFSQKRNYFNRDNNTKNILYAPTWRPYDETKLFPFDDLNVVNINQYLEEENAVIYLRLHPNFESKIDESLLSDRVKLLTKKNIDDINEILGEFELLITDYSSIYIDFLLTNKPIIFLPYDQDLYSEIIGFSIDYDKYTPGPKPKMTDEFLRELSLLLNDRNYFSEARKQVNAELNYICENPAEQNKDLILSLLSQ